MPPIIPPLTAPTAAPLPPPRPVIFPTAAAYLMTTWALSRVESSVVALFIYLQPLIASGLSIAFLGDRIAPREILGAVLVFASVYLALRRPGRARPRSR